MASVDNFGRQSTPVENVRAKARTVSSSILKGALILWLAFGLPVEAQQMPSIEMSSVRLMNDVSILAGLRPHRNYRHLTSLDSAARLVESAFRRLDCEVSLQTFQVDSLEYRNVVASFGPANAPRLVIGAHYDVCGDQPGADDNASGVAGLLELARLIDLERPVLNYRIELVAYTLEEPPFFRTEFMGSYHHASRLSADKVDVALMISVEMIGFFTDRPRSQQYPVFFLDWFYPDAGNYISVVGRFGQGDRVERVSDLMKQYSHLPVSSISAPGFIKGIDFSDHMNYWKFGYDAVMITDTAFLRNPNYHEPTDTPETLDYGRMAEVVHGLYGIVVNW